MIPLMKNRRRVLGLLLLTALLAAGVGATLPFLSSGLPDPAVANHDELLQWIVARDLTLESPKTRLVLAQRLEQQLCEGIDWDSLNKQTTEAQRRQLWKNIPLMFGPWLSDKAETYARLSKAQRAKFMDRILATILAWHGADRLQTQQDKNTPSGASRGLLSVLMDEVETCKRNAEPSEREHLSQFLLALQMRFLMR